MTSLVWVLGILIALLTAFNTISWGFAIREVGDPQLSLDFLLRLALNKWYVLALASALVASILGYVVLREMGVLVGRFFLGISVVTTILASTLVLGEKISLKEWIGIALVLAGIVVLGR